MLEERVIRRHLWVALRKLRDERDPLGYAPDLWRRMAEMGWASIILPEEYGGLGGGIFEMVIATEELSRVCGGIALAFAASALGAMPILLFGSDEQKKKYLPPIASGEKLAAFARGGYSSKVLMSWPT